MDIARIIGGTILLLFAIWCFTTFPDGLTMNTVTKCIAGGAFGGFGVILILLGFQKQTAMVILGVILLTASIFVIMGIPELAIRCIVCGILAGLGILLIALGFKRK